MKKWEQLASDEVIAKTVSALKQNNIEAEAINSGADAKARVFELIPSGAQVMTMSSTTLVELGLDVELNERYNSVKKQLSTMDRETQNLEMQQLGAAPEWAVGSVHSVTEKGEVLIASNSGSQIPAYAYGSPHVIWLMGTQKIVPDLQTGMKRIYEYNLVKENDRVKKKYGPETASEVGKLLIFNKEKIPGRVTLIFNKEKLGF